MRTCVCVYERESEREGQRENEYDKANVIKCKHWGK